MQDLRVDTHVQLHINTLLEIVHYTVDAVH